MHDGLLEVTVIPKGVREIQLNDVVLGSDLRRLPKLRNRPCEIPAEPPGLAEIVVRLCRLRGETSGLFELFDARLESAALQIRGTERISPFRVGGMLSDHPLSQPDVFSQFVLSI